MILSQYCYILHKFFTEQECELIHKVADTIPLMEGLIGQNDEDPDSPKDTSGTNDSYIRQSDVKWIEHDKMYQEIQDKITDGVNEACRQCNWNHQWDFVENHQYTIYRHRPEAQVTGDHYTWHTDASDRAQLNGRLRKISSTIQLSKPDDYEGGHFQWIEPQGIFDKLKATGTHNINVDKHIISAPFSAKEKGSFIIFPSFVHHQVTPVTRGTRISLVSWYHGNPYV